LAVELQAQLRDGTVINDGVWVVRLDDNNIVFQ